MAEHLYDYDRSFNPYEGDYYNYGSGPEHSFFDYGRVEPDPELAVPEMGAAPAPGQDRLLNPQRPSSPGGPRPRGGGPGSINDGGGPGFGDRVIDLGWADSPWASLVPGAAGLGLGVAKAGARLNNVRYADKARRNFETIMSDRLGLDATGGERPGSFKGYLKGAMGRGYGKPKAALGYAGRLEVRRELHGPPVGLRQPQHGASIARCGQPARSTIERASAGGGKVAGVCAGVQRAAGDSRVGVCAGVLTGVHGEGPAGNGP